MHKAIRHPAPEVLHLDGFLARFRAMFRFQVPVGFQDEKGFHYGVKRSKGEIKWPPVD